MFFRNDIEKNIFISIAQPNEKRSVVKIMRMIPRLFLLLDAMKCSYKTSLFKNAVLLH